MTSVPAINFEVRQGDALEILVTCPQAKQWANRDRADRVAYVRQAVERLIERGETDQEFQPRRPR